MANKHSRKSPNRSVGISGSKVEPNLGISTRLGRNSVTNSLVLHLLLIAEYARLTPDVYSDGSRAVPHFWKRSRKISRHATRTFAVVPEPVPVRRPPISAKIKRGNLDVLTQSIMAGRKPDFAEPTSRPRLSVSMPFKPGPARSLRSFVMHPHAPALSHEQNRSIRLTHAFHSRPDPV